MNRLAKAAGRKKAWKEKRSGFLFWPVPQLAPLESPYLMILPLPLRLGLFLKMSCFLRVNRNNSSFYVTPNPYCG